MEDKKYSVEESIELITRGISEVIGLDEIKEKLKSGKQLTVKAGFDPTAPDIHLGHTVLLRKMRHFQLLGHKVIFLIGDFTGRIGDPSGKTKTRPRLTLEDVLKNAETYKQQVFKILDPEKTIVEFNSKWLEKMSFADVLGLTSRYTVAQMIERDDFSKRYKNGQPISIMEFLYPLAQGYDSVALECDVELGGNDQKFNLLVGRTLMKEYGLSPQAVITVPLLEGLDGVEKMSKSLGNYIGIYDSAKDMYGKAMSIPDSLISKYMELLTDIPIDDIKNYVKAMENGENPRNIKGILAKEIVKIYHGEEEALNAEEEFKRIFSSKGLPDEIEEVTINKDENILNVLATCMSSESKSNLKRLVSQGSVTLDNEKINDINALVSKEGILKVGKRNFFKIKFS
ncbi:tyrosine--tRNA ligase [Brachyspira hyodysenteriae]|uniref:Tyrosine--tRNA ligase n=2 Tax=Brachyspira hyodysenteriae TaxID=159 RepID=A0A3B6V882_BRAHW|nr:tyrosine--tRNA ligase [Brachyspira hyodysenteriae]ACN82746.1 tyrosyl-tRNA synthetase [Brachyspira hyodysenteriae WA1]ANN62626.1 tyrosine--tRNA ligase [Brachyspira hyodysenteriae ATCC 27164]AUJ48497.1 tyrosine--tRNA ligase [Brachyspira hyodysenteriae]KLI13111.1 tyrosyl-tRNA synthetase [Brachyspira hyodysenteriae]KLI15350.1 tyrosyl-tRNA synthetase [Brachyspira hyodysenteriae]